MEKLHKNKQKAKFNLGIIGNGYVGGTATKAFSRECNILTYDKYQEKYTNPEVLIDAKIIFLCVPTPMKKTGEMDNSAIYSAMDTLSELKYKKTKPLVVIRSTSIPGTTDLLDKKYDFDFVFNPEFLREKHALEDFLNSNRVIFGVKNQRDFNKVKSLYKKVLPDAKYVKTTRKAAEMIKYAANITLASQITIANEMHNICGKLGVDYDEVKNALLLDERIGTNIDVPGPDNNPGFGGKCFPKDLNALIYLAEKQGYSPDLFKQVWASNLKFRENQDWNKIPGATSKNKNFKKK